MDDAVREDLACLSASPYRGPVLACLASGPCSRRDLQAETGASKATVSRALSAFGDRGWVETTGSETTLTPLGHIVADAVSEFTSTMETAAQLRAVVDHLPIDEFGFDLSCLTDASVITPTQSDPLAPIRHADRFLVGASEIHVLSHSFSPGVVTVLAERATVDASIRVVVTSDVVAAVTRDEDVRTTLAELVATAPDAFLVTQAPIPYILAAADGVVSFGVTDEDGGLVGVVDTEHPTVYEWARSTVQAYAEDASPVDPDKLAE